VQRVRGLARGALGSIGGKHYCCHEWGGQVEYGSEKY